MSSLLGRGCCTLPGAADIIWVAMDGNPMSCFFMIVFLTSGWYERSMIVDKSGFKLLNGDWIGMIVRVEAMTTINGAGSGGCEDGGGSAAAAAAATTTTTNTESRGGS